jgi:hypothetical protein
VENNHRAHGPNSNKLFDPPILLQRKSHGDHHCRHNNAEHEAPLELPQHAANGHEETDVFAFLGGGTPLERPADEMREESLRDVQGDAAKEDGEKRNPFHVCPEATEDGTFADAVAEDGEGDVAKDTEDNYDGKVD